MLARGATGAWDGYLWTDHMLPLVAGASTRANLSRRVRLSWDGDLMFGMPAGARAFEFGMQHAGELAFVPNWHWQLSLRVAAVWYPTFPGDRFQSSLGSVLRYVFVKDAVGARFVMNLDGPHGFAFSREGMWGLALFYQWSLEPECQPAQWIQVPSHQLSRARCRPARETSTGCGSTRPRRAPR